MLKILITGGSGLLATNWACYAREKHKVILGIHNTSINLRGVEVAGLNLESKGSVVEDLKVIKPDIVIHSAGLTNVDVCEKDPELANHVNCELSENVASACAKLDIKLVHISTDHLFAGHQPFSDEDAKPHPVNTYAISKLCAESRVQSVDPEALVIRTNFFGWGHRLRQSFSDWVLENVSTGIEITLFDDVYFTPILIDTAAEYVHQLLDVNAKGIFNVVSDERVSKYQFGCQLTEKFGLPSELLKRASISSAHLIAPRPSDMSLSNKKLKELTGLESVPLSKQLDLLKLQVNQGRLEEIKNAIRES